MRNYCVDVGHIGIIVTVGTLFSILVKVKG